MRLRLFQITDTSTGKPVPELFFNEKHLAKKKRQELNGSPEVGSQLRYVVSPGPDHRNYKKSSKT
jgi:hypothetical protein